MLYDVSERQAKRLRPTRYTEIFVPDAMGNDRIIGVQDTTSVEEACAEERKTAPDFRFSKNTVSGKWLAAARIPAIVLNNFFGGSHWRNAPQESLEKMMSRFFAAHPEFTVQKPRTLGLGRR